METPLIYAIKKRASHAFGLLVSLADVDLMWTDVVSLATEPTGITATWHVALTCMFAGAEWQFSAALVVERGSGKLGGQPGQLGGTIQYSKQRKRTRDHAINLFKKAWNEHAPMYPERADSSDVCSGEERGRCPGAPEARGDECGCDVGRRGAPRASRLPT